MLKVAAVLVHPYVGELRIMTVTSRVFSYGFVNSVVFCPSCVVSLLCCTKRLSRATLTFAVRPNESDSVSCQPPCGQSITLFDGLLSGFSGFPLFSEAIQAV